MNNGKEINYALGISVDSSRGWKRFSHYGGIFGYNTVIMIYPDLKMGLVVFNNSGDDKFDSKIDSLETILIPDISNKKVIQPAIQRDSSLAILRNPDDFKQFEGDYIADNANQRKFSIINGKLYMNKRIPMVHESGNTFSMLNNPSAKYTFNVHDKEVGINYINPGLSEPIHFIKAIKGLILPEEELQTYTGMYYSPELGCIYRIILKDHQLFFTNNINGDAKITLMGKDDLLSDYDFLYHFKVLRANNNKIIDLELNSGDIMNLRFHKIE